MSSPRNDLASSPAERLRKLRLGSLLVGVIASVPCIMAALGEPTRFMQAYLVAWIFTLGVSMGSLGVLLLHRVSGGAWGNAITRFAERGSALVPVLALAFIPIAIDLPRLYLWAQPDVVSADEVLQEKAIYLNPESFRLRAAGYLVLWSLLAIVLRGSRRWKLPGNVSGVGMAVYFLTSTFAAVDWIMSLEPHWFSSTFGAMFVVGQALSGLSFCVLAYVSYSTAPAAGSLARKVLRDLNNLVLAFVMLWAYIAFTQYLIIYYGNLAEEAVWYVERTEGGWEWISLVLIAFHYAVPFLALVGGAGKENPKVLGWITAGILLVHWFDIYWLIIPAFSPGHLEFSWLEPTVAIAMGAWWLAAWSWQPGALEPMAEAGA
ncbi:MAG TPA: hypothetical protein VG713_11285 [Pirellulales bacterium]|nr:hypothetical protein [Pirellulales bacterium]